jgi:hypothetical protein
MGGGGATNFMATSHMHENQQQSPRTGTLRSKVFGIGGGGG